MSIGEELVYIETDLFLFEVPAGFEIEELDEQAEIIGPADEFLVVASYTVDEECSMDDLDAFAKNIGEAMLSAAQEPGLVLTDKLRKEKSEQGFAVWSIKAEGDDKSHFFDQYSIIDRNTAVVVTIEGNYEDRGSSALIEEAVHALEFK